MKPKVQIPYPEVPVVRDRMDAKATAIVARVERVSSEVKRAWDSEPPQSLPGAALGMAGTQDPLLAEAMASNAELSLLVLQRLGKMDEQISQINRWRERQENVEHRATEILITERKSKIALEEEVTRADIHIKKVRSEKLWTIAAKVLAVVMTPPGAWGLWQWVSEHLLK
jgi:hypothetical protein